MIREVCPTVHYRLADYSAHLALQQPVDELRRVAALQRRALQRRCVWMLSSTARGGGVAEMLPGLVALLNELGVQTRWLVIEPQEKAFFELTKRLHNLLHDAPAPVPGPAGRELYVRVSERLAEALQSRVGARNLLVVHDPQPLGCGAVLVRNVGIRAIWRCHVGYEEETPRTRAAWDFLAPWLGSYRRYVFSLPEYAPRELAQAALVIPPAIDPLSHKNRELSVQKLTGILRAGRLIGSEHPQLVAPFPQPVRRLASDGAFVSADAVADLGLLHRPVLTQISRWDRLKGWHSLLEGFAALKCREAPVRRRSTLVLRHARLVLAGPDPGGVSDDPEAGMVLEELRQRWLQLPAAVQDDVAIILLPMADMKRNALLVNALQRCSTVLVQNSLREGFGLTVTEALWKSAAVLGSSAAGIRSQITDRVEGRLSDRPEDPGCVAERLAEMLTHSKECDTYGLNGQRKVAREFLIFSQARRWLEMLGALARE